MKISYLTPKSIGRLHCRLLCSYAQRHQSEMQAQRYSMRSVYWHIKVFVHLDRWLRQQSLGLKALNEENVDAFMVARYGLARTANGARTVVDRLLERLRADGVAPAPKLAPTTPAAELLGDYRRYLLNECGLGTDTADKYARYAGLFVGQYMPSGRADAKALVAHHTTCFLNRFIAEHPGMGAQKVAVALRSFLRFLRYQGDVVADLAASIPVVASWPQTSLPKILPPGAVKKVLMRCDRRSVAGRRDYAILLLLARLGLRGAEVASLRLEDIDWANSQITVRSNKGHGWGRLPLPREVGGAIARYLRRDRPACSSRHVFVRVVAPFVELGRVAVIAGITRRAIQRAGIESPRKGAHVFRHTLATDMLRRGATLREIGQVLRHRHADTTAIYAKVDLETLRPLALRWPGGGQ